MVYVLLPSSASTVKDDVDVPVPASDSPSFPDDRIGTIYSLCSVLDGIS